MHDIATAESSLAVKPVPRVAVIGAGISGLSAAWHLAQQGAAVTLYESEDRLGGHAHTVDVTLNTAQGKQIFPVDTGFLVFNHRTYPGLKAFFETLNIATDPSDMGFSVQVKKTQRLVDASPTPTTALEWAGNSLSSVFTQRRNLLRPAFWRMLREMLRFNKEATAYALRTNSDGPAGINAQAETLGDFLQRGGYSDALRDWYLVPMAAAIWSCPTATMMGYPMATFARFCHNHGLLQISNRPQWYTVRGGSRVYVQRVKEALDRMDAAVHTSAAVLKVEALPSNKAQEAPALRVHTAAGAQDFAAVVMAAHSTQSLAQLSHANAADGLDPLRQILERVGYQSNTAVLHTDARVLPAHPRAWAAWNYETHGSGEPNTQTATKAATETASNAETQAGNAPNSQRVCLHYLLNKLQVLPVGLDTPVVVSLNPITPIDPQLVLQTIAYDHPVFDGPAIAAQNALHAVQGTGNVWLAGAWTHYGFHEDGYQSGKRAAEGVAQRLGLTRAT